MDIYSLLNKIVVTKIHCLSEQLFKDEDKNKLETEEDKQLFVLIKNVSSLATRIDLKGVTFLPHIIWEGKRSFALEDMVEEDYALLAVINIDKVPLCLRARIADILWTQKKNYKYALIAIKAYMELFQILFSPEDWVGTLDYIRRSISISAQIKEPSLYNAACKIIYDCVVTLDGTDENFLSLRLLDILVEQDYGEIDVLLAVIENIIAKNQNNAMKIEQAYALKISFLKKKGAAPEVKKVNLQLASYYIKYAAKFSKNDVHELFRAETFMKKAITLYRNNGETEIAEGHHRKLIELQKEIPKRMTPITHTFDMSDYLQKLDLYFTGLTFEESILRIAQMIDFFQKDTLKEQLFKDYKEHPISHIGGRSVINSSGQTILTLPPLDISNPEKNSELLDMYINLKLIDNADISGFLVNYALDKIRQSHVFSEASFDFLINDNPIIPEGREDMFRAAIFMILQGNYYEAMHILAPQTENLFRTIAEMVGGLTVTLEDDGTSKQKVLKSVFNIPELIECYDNDILFVFKALLNEPSGANIRNNIAHGLIDKAQASSGVHLYFAGAVIKLLTYTSINCIKILIESENLKKSHASLNESESSNESLEK